MSDERTRALLQEAIDKVSLRADEALIRADMAYAVAGASWWAVFDSYYSQRLVCMVITNRRVVFMPPHTGWRYALRVCWNWRTELLWRADRNDWPRPRLKKRIDVELGDVTRIWKWQPEFSGPVRLQLGPARHRDFELAQQSEPWLPLHYGLTDDKRDHVESLEAAWRSAHEHRAAS